MTTPDPSDDRRIAEAVVSGDRGALAEMYDRYASHLYDYCCRLLSDPDAATDAAQDVFVAAWLHVGQLRDPERLRAWLYALARAQILTHPTGAAIDLLPTPLPAHDPGSTQPAELARRALDDLDVSDREAVDLALRHGLGQADLAAVLGVAEEEAYARVTRARARFEGAVAAMLAPASGKDQPPAVALLGELPLATPPPQLRERVMHTAFDPELGSYRAHVTVPAFDARGFPAQPGVPSGAGRRWALTGAAVVLVLAAVTAGGGVLLARDRGDGREARDEAAGSPALPSPNPALALPSGKAVHGPIPGTTSPSATASHTATPADDPSDSRVRPQSRPSGDRGGDRGDPPATRDAPTRLTASPGRLDLGTGSSGTVVLRATGGALLWGSDPSTDVLSVSPESGAIPEGGRMQVTITLDRSRVSGPGRAHVRFGTLRGQRAIVEVVWS